MCSNECRYAARVAGILQAGARAKILERRYMLECLGVMFVLAPFI